MGQDNLSKEVFDIHLEHIRESLHDIRNNLGELSLIREEQTEQGKTLVRNTVSLEEHVRRTNLLEIKLEHVENEVNGLRTHVTKVNTVMGLFKPTKEKIKWLIIVASLCGGSYGGYQLSDEKGLNKAMQVIERVFAE